MMEELVWLTGRSAFVEDPSNMNFQRKFVTSVLLLLLLLTEACNKKKPVLPVQAGVPTTVAEVLPDEIPENPETEIAEVPRPTPQPQQQTKSKPKKQPRTQAAKKTTPPTNTAAATPPPPAQSSAATNNQQQVAALRPPHNASPESTPDLAIVAAVPSQQASQQKEDAAHMVDATENELKNINRSLSEDEKAMRTQIQSYLQQARKATVDGDYERAYNLAKKAQLLADALIKK
ncbi:MAG: hypothetical protein WBS19_02400 [Candidatus Korobacteraceae bacterium]